jgi:hypothetical protein
MLTSWFRSLKLKAGIAREDIPGYSATGLSSGSFLHEIED